jgi:hypothetical protein
VTTTGLGLIVERANVLNRSEQRHTKTKVGIHKNSYDNLKIILLGCSVLTSKC